MALCVEPEEAVSVRPTIVKIVQDYFFLYKNSV
jgi:hypothetical protein